MSEQSISLAGDTEDTDATVLDTPEVTPVPVRAFYRSDYARFAGNLRRARHVMGNPHTPKPAEVQASIDAAANALADVFAADADGHEVPGVAPFNRELFITGSML